MTRAKGSLKLAARPTPFADPDTAVGLPAMVVTVPYAAPGFTSIFRIKWFVVSAT